LIVLLSTLLAVDVRLRRLGGEMWERVNGQW
jgi:hypothetical protein